MPRRPDHLIPMMALRRAPDTVVARVGLGATFYLAEPLSWARAPIGAAFRAFLELVPPRWLRWYTTSAMTGWLPVSESSLAMFARHLSLPDLQRARHGLRFRIVDDRDVPSVGFDYREVDPEREQAAATLEITTPQDFEPRDLMQLVLRISSLGPLWCAVGGYAARWNAAHKSSAFWQAHRWSKRFLCLDVQDPAEISWQVREGLPGTGWLTLIGGALAKERKIPIDALGTHNWGRPEITALPSADGLLVRAGERPTVGDLNWLEYPSAHAAVNRTLAPWLIDPLRPMWGGFYEGEQTRRWQRRFVEPEGWAR